MTCAEHLEKILIPDMTNDKNRDQSAAPLRKRGRPTGQNRVPLSLEERRARNALYERERRNEAADAMAQLAEAVGCEPNVPNADVMAAAILRLQQSAAASELSSEHLKRINCNLESQIAMLQEQLGLDDESFARLDVEYFLLGSTVESAAESHQSNNSSIKPNKRRVSRSSSGHRAKRLRLETETSTDPQPAGASDCPQISLAYLTESEIELVSSWLDDNLINYDADND